MEIIAIVVAVASVIGLLTRIAIGGVLPVLAYRRGDAFEIEYRAWPSRLRFKTNGSRSRVPSVPAFDFAEANEPIASKGELIPLGRDSEA